MKNTLLLISIISFVILPNIEADGYGEILLTRLNTEIQRMNDLVIKIQDHYRGKLCKNSADFLPKSYENTLRRKDDVRNSMSNEREQNFGVSTRRSNGQLNWKENFYKALSRALKDEFKDEPIIQEHVNDGFEPPARLQKRNRQ